MDDLRTQAIDIRSDVEDLFDSYDIGDLTEEDELHEYVTKIGDAKRDYRRVHSHLKIADGDEFPTKYPKFDEDLVNLNEKFKTASKKLSEVRKLGKQIAVDTVKFLEPEKAQADKEKLQCKTDRKFFIEQAEWELGDCTWKNVHEFEEIKAMISTFESRLDKFYKICSDLEVWYGDQVGELGFQVENEKLISSLREKINSGKSRLVELKSEKERLEVEKLEKVEKARLLAESDRIAQAKRDEKAKIDDIMVCAKNLHFEIKTRHETFKKKCLVEISELSDYEILDLRKREECLHVELRELIDKVSSFVKFVLPCGDSAKDLREEVIKMRNTCATEMDKILAKVAEAIKGRDISEKKLKNSAGLNIQLQKFKGYNSEMDVYTFRSDFRKLIEPNVQKGLWSDYLKKNCLAGAAYNLVSKIEIIEDIWEKLFEVYGNTQLMLQNKLGSLEKFSNLEKMKDDEKIAYTIAGLLNAMADLCKLAEDNSLEDELYHGGGMHKILDLMGKQRERKFIKSIALGKLSNKVKWTKLAGFLKSELKEREALVLNEKVRKCMNLDKSKSDDKDRDKEKQSRDKKTDDSKSTGYMGQNETTDLPSGRCACFICGKTDDHVLSVDGNKKPYVEYVACKTFVAKSPRERDKLLFKKHFCSKCLKPGVRWNSEHVCSKQYACNQTYVKNEKELKCEKHVLVCGYHCKNKGNDDLLKLYKKNVIEPHGKFFDFSKEVSISCFSEIYSSDAPTSDVDESSVFAFQTIDVGGLKLNLFYDSGCGDLVVSKAAVDKLKEIGRATQEFAGPIILSGVGNQESVCKHGAYSIRLPLRNGSEARMCGVCVDEVTTQFPMYPLKQVEKDFRGEVEGTNKDLLPKLPKLPNEVGGKVNIMLGKHYLKYFPREVARLKSGLTLYESMFESPDRSTGVISGPHPEFTKINRTAHLSHEKRYSYYTPAVRSYIDFLSTVDDVPLLGHKGSFADLDRVRLLPGNICINDNGTSTNSDLMSTFPGKVDSRCEFGDPVAGGSGVGLIANKVYVSRRGPKCLKMFEELEKTGTDISYRCMDCRNCKECKKGSLIEEISIQEEVEQDLINKSVTVDIESRTCSADLPFIADPDTRLVSNHRPARKVYDSQIRSLNKSPKDRSDIIEAEGKLQNLGYVDYLDNLDKNDQNMILSSPVQHFIPWRVVWSKSVSTPIRPVFDASSRTASGYSLNDILPKGSNNMNNLVEIIIRWSIKLFGYHTDVRKMYNSVLMNKDFWRFQLYWWAKNLGLDEEPVMKVIKTCIYGVKCSGNQAERALRMVAELMIDKYPIAFEIVMNDIYVDDCISGEGTEDERAKATDELRLSLEKGGFTLKGFTFSGQDPDVNLSSDGESVMVGGLKWFPKKDYIKLNISELNFARKIRGRKLENKNSIPDDLTMRNCVSVAAEVFDPTGRVTPIIAGIKLDISHLHRSGLTWDGQIPENLRGVWVSNFEMIQELGQIKYKRAIVPPDAKNLDIVTIDTGDASSSMICAAIYARFEKKDSSYSCQLVFARSKVLPEGISIPRAELMASNMNAATGFTVQKAFGRYHKKCFKLTDSMVALHWIASQRTALKTWVRTRVIEINRLCEASDWRYVESSNMVADLGTRKGVKVADVAQDSVWINGLPWMSKPEEEFPTLTMEEIRLNQQDMEEANKEKVITKSFHNHRNVELDSSFDEQVRSRYMFSDYLIDPNRHRFRKVVRILSLVLTFVKKASKKRYQRVQENKVFLHKSPGDLPDVLQTNMDKYVLTTGSQLGGKVVEINENMMKSALYYFSLKASEEVKEFLDISKYINITREIDGVLYYSGRILEDYKYDGYPELCEVAIDLCPTSFCVPVMDQYSPVAISIAMEIHWYHPGVKHAGIEAILRQMQGVAHIIGGRKLAKSIKRGCKKCRILNRESIDIAMGPIQNVNLCIAPAFYASQLDIFGPFKSYSNANKRATIKVWFLIFCCCTTGAIDIRVMEDYSTESVVLAFIRFSCRFGYPKYVLPDAGSQLVKSCEDMRYSFTDTKHKLSVEYGVQYTTCPVGAHYMHGKVERKIREVKKSVKINAQNERLSIVQWETLMQQIANSVNNLPIGLKNKTQDLENLDLITPNRLILGRNNERSPNAPLTICADHKKLIENNALLFSAWFKAWIISYVPSLVERPKWHKNDKDMIIGDIVLFLKSEKEYDEQYQYGKVCEVHKGKDGLIRRVDVEYRNPNEGIKRVTQRGVRDLVIVSPVDELDIYERLSQILDNCE